MTTFNPHRKSRCFFEMSNQAIHVTFDDGETVRRNFPWTRFTEARWRHQDPGSFKIEIGEYLVILTGHNLAPLFEAIEQKTLVRLKAMPHLAKDPDHEIDSFVTEIRFIETPADWASAGID